METKDFLVELRKRLIARGCTDEPELMDTMPTWYSHDWGSLNTVGRGVYYSFDTQGDVVWITVPCLEGEFKGFKMQLCVRTFDKVYCPCACMYGEPVNTVAVSLFFIDSTAAQGWHNLAVYDFCAKDLKRPSGNLKSLVNETVRSRTLFGNGPHFLPGTQLLDAVMDIVSRMERWWSGLDDGERERMRVIRQGKSSRNKQKAWRYKRRGNGADPLMRMFGDLFKIR